MKIDKMNFQELLIVARDESLTISELLELSEHSFAQVRRNVAQNRSASKEILDNLSCDPDDTVRFWVANNPNTSLETIRKLSEDKSYEVRLEVARTPYASDRVIGVNLLIKTKDNFEQIVSVKDIHRALALNEHISKNAINKLAESKHVVVRKAIAFHPKANERVLEILANDENSEVRLWVARHPNTPEWVLYDLERDEDSFVKEEAYKALKERDELEKFQIEI